MKNYTQKFIGILTLVFSMSFTVNSQEIGDVYEGGYIFQIDEDGTGLVADLQDLGLMNWYDAINIAETISSGGYEDWLLPSLEQLELMYETIGIGGPENIGGFETYTWPYYWSSTEQSANYAWLVSFGASNPGGTGSDNKNDMGVVRVIRSVTFGEEGNTEGDTTALDDTADNYLDLPEGWSMFGYTCLDSLDAMEGFSSISDKIEIVKDEWGLSYLPSWEFNAMGSLQFSEGYQIKMIEEVTDFQFCEAIVPEDGITQADVDAAYTDGAASVTPEDGITQEDLNAAVAAVEASYVGWTAPVYGCTGPDNCNYNPDAIVDDGSCVYAQEGYDCDGNVILHIGDQYAGGIVFQINEDGTGLVADLQDLGEMDWFDAMDVAESFTSQGYEDWYLPNTVELVLMHNTIGYGGPDGNIGGFSYSYYWSSESSFGAYAVEFIDGPCEGPVSCDNGYNLLLYYQYSSLRVRVIRAF